MSLHDLLESVEVAAAMNGLLHYVDIVMMEENYWYMTKVKVLEMERY